MKNILRTLLVVSFLMTCSQMDAQVFKGLGKRLLEKLENKAEERLENKADETTDQVLDTIFEGSHMTKRERRRAERARKRAENGQNSSNGIKGIMGMMENMMGGDVTIEDQYNFHTTITMDHYGMMGAPGQMKQVLGDQAFISDVGAARTIMDAKNDAMITLMDERMEAQVMSMKALGAMIPGNAGEVEETVEPIITPLDETREILGYQCKGLSIETDEMVIEMWYTEDIDIDRSGINAMLSKMPGASREMNKLGALENYGFTMQMDTYFKAEDRTFGTLVTDIDRTPITINMNDYNILKF